MKLLVLTGETISARHISEALGAESDPEDAEVMVVAPAFQENPIKFWMSDPDDAIARAEQVRSATVEELGEDGVAASGNTGDSDPLEAIQDALQTFAADRILLFTRAGSDQRYREDVDPSEIEQRFGLPVTVASVPDSAA